jgi:hypothetical protein
MLDIFWEVNENFGMPFRFSILDLPIDCIGGTIPIRIQKKAKLIFGFYSSLLPEFQF